MNLDEARLFRILTSFFGGDRVFYNMTVLTVCGGALPKGEVTKEPSLEAWANTNNCLFTIVDSDDEPRLVIEFFSGFDKAIDPVEVDHQRYLVPLMRIVGILYVTITPDEFDAILSPQAEVDFCTFLLEKVNEL